jgi:hypothetical protein
VLPRRRDRSLTVEGTGARRHGVTDNGGSGGHGTGRSAVLVWIDTREALIARWLEDAPVLERLESDVPAHHKSTGLVRFNPAVRHGGGGRPQEAGEPHRLEHLAQFVKGVGERLDAAQEIVVIGPGTVREHLVGHLHDLDDARNRIRPITTEAAPRLTRRQLIARLRQLVHEEPRRGIAGAHRWSEPAAVRASGAPMAIARRAGPRPPRQPMDDELEPV